MNLIDQVLPYITTIDNENFKLILRYGNNGKPDFGHKNEKWSVVATRNIPKGEWIDILYEIKWSFSNDGYVASWVNNEPFTCFNGLHNKIFGANMHNDSPAYFKFGQYRYYDEKNTHKIFFDELRIGDTFEEVSIYKNLPDMFTESQNYDFIRIHK